METVKCWNTDSGCEHEAVIERKKSAFPEKEKQSF